jgi:phosphotransferase system HPr (HPr) family protein
MTERRVTVTDPAGLHARQAAGVVRVASRFGSRTIIRHDGREANARSIIELLGLAIGPSTEVTLVAHGEDAEAALDALAQQLAPHPPNGGAPSTRASSSRVMPEGRRRAR